MVCSILSTVGGGCLECFRRNHTSTGTLAQNSTNECRLLLATALLKDDPFVQDCDRQQTMARVMSEMLLVGTGYRAGSMPLAIW